MQLWLDTIDQGAVLDAASKKVISGVTTNPSILSKSIDPKETLSWILNHQKGNLAVQVMGGTKEEIFSEGKYLFSLSPRIVVKVPVTDEGLRGSSLLIEKEIPCMATSILTVEQALLSALQGATFIAPYFTHMEAPQKMLRAIIEIYRANQFKTKILVAALRSVEDLLFCASLGVDAVTIKADLYFQLFQPIQKVEHFLELFREGKGVR